MEAEKERWVAVSPDEAAWYEYLEMYLKDGPLKEFRMHCYAFVMLYLKDGPLRSSNYFQLFLC